MKKITNIPRIVSTTVLLNLLLFLFFVGTTQLIHAQDADNDMILDDDDLDSDNDGILDILECPNNVITLGGGGTFGSGEPEFGPALSPEETPYTYSEAPSAINNYSIIKDTESIDFVACCGFDLFRTLYDRTDPGNGYFAYFDLGLFDRGDPVLTDALSVEENTTYEISFWAAAPYKFIPNSTTIIDIKIDGIVFETAVVAYDTDWVNYSYIYTTPSGTTEILFEIINEAIGGTLGSDLAIDDIKIASLDFTCPDTDADGVPDYLDLDSDNDGCPDFIEGGAAFTYEHAVLAEGDLDDGNGNMVTQNLGNEVGSNGVPIVADSGQSISDSQDASANICNCNLTCEISLISDVSVHGLADGSAVATPLTGTAPYVYAWDNGEAQATAIMLDAGLHTVTITDAFQCESICEVNIIEPYIGIISGTVKEDIDNDDLPDQGIADLPVALFTTGNDILALSYTNESGEYIFTDLAPGDYFVAAEQPLDYINVSEGDNQPDESDDSGPNDMPMDNVIYVSLTENEADYGNDFVDRYVDPCIAWEQAEANSVISVGVVTAPNLIASEEDLVNITFVVVNTGTEPIADFELTTDLLFLSGMPTGASLIPSFAGDPNNNGLIDINEIWFYSAVQSFEYNEGDTFVITCGGIGQVNCGEEIGAAASILFTSGANMDVNIEQECASPGDVIDVTLTTRLLIDEDAAKNPGSATVIVSGVPIIVQLPETQWEARDLMLTATMLNGGVEFDPFDPPAGIVLTNFCEQGGIDTGRNTDNILDECESIETVRAPCTTFGEDDVLCEYPEWVFCYSITIPEDYLGTEFTVEATDDFNLWKAEESPAGSGNFNDFIDFTNNVETGGTDSETIEIKPTGVLPVDIISFEAKKDGRTSTLIWKTASETNNSHFNIERSVDGANYEVIGKVLGNGTTVSQNEYRYIDDSPVAGFNYYRLAQFDYDGTLNRTDVRTVDFTYKVGSGQISVYPNPVVDFVIIETEDLINTVSVVLFSIDGKKVVETKITPGDQIELSDVPVGLYTIKVYDEARYEIGTQQLTIVR